MRPLLAFLMTGFLLVASSPAWAGCHQMTAQQAADLEATNGTPAQMHTTFTAVFPEQTIDLDPDFPIGGTITTGQSASVPAPGLFFIYCDPPSGTISYAFTSAPMLSSLGNNIYNTNVPGVGYRLSYVRASGSTSVVPYVNSWTPQVAGKSAGITYGAGALFQVELIKTSNAIPSLSTVTLGQIGRGFGDADGITVTDIFAGNVTIQILPKCQVNSSTLNVDFGQFGPQDVSTTSGPTQPVNFTVICTGPTPPASITATLGAPPDTANPGLIQNTGAQNLAIRLEEPSSGTILRPNNANSTLVHLPNGATQSAFNLEATVLRVGSATPTAGTIDATAVVTLTIQ
jgi:type 1 fimbria pilin